MVVASQKGAKRAALLAKMDQGAFVETTVVGQQAGEHSVYTTDLSYFAAAAVVVIFSVAVILPAYWGWWRLGRPVSFSPLELAKVWCFLEGSL